MSDDRRDSDWLDRLYELLPTIHRMRDEERGGPLRALLRVIAEQVNVVEDDIAQLYENWFIETCDDWVVPYIGELIGYRPVHEAGEPGEVTTAQSRARNKILLPRRDVANTIFSRRRKGTLALLELLARNAADWPARAVEFHTLLGWTQHLDHQRPERGRTADLRDNNALAGIDGPFDSIAHTVDVRRIASERAPGRYNIPSVGVFVWRLKPYTVGADHLRRSRQIKQPSAVRTPAYCIEERGPQCFTISALGHDTQLFVKPRPETDPTQIAEAMNLPVPLHRWAFDQHKEDFYGEGKSLEIWAPGWSTYDPAKPLPVEAIVPADLSDWSYQPPPNRVAVDPVLGRMVFRPSLPRKRGVRVAYAYGFSADMGGGEYNRPLSQPAGAVLVRVGVGEQATGIGAAWKCLQKAWEKNPGRQKSGVIEIVDSSVYTEQLAFELKEGQSLQIRAASRVRPVLRLIDWHTDLPDSLSVMLPRGSRITFDGLLVAGRSVAIIQARPDNLHEEPGAEGTPQTPAPDEAAVRPENGDQEADLCPPEVNIRHCTLVPGWSLHPDCEPKSPAEPSLELINTHARLRIEHSIIGSIQITEDQVRSDPIPVTITDSILDATSNEREALGAPGRPVAHALLTIVRCTVFGEVLVHAIGLAENCIFNNCLSVARRQLGCMRFCYVPKGCRTPRRYHCQPDLAEQTIEARLRAEADRARKANKPAPSKAALEAEITAAKAREQDRVRPRFNSVRYGRPDYAQLADSCAEEIKRGADDESEMGVFHDLFNPQRETNLRARLDEHTPAGLQAGIIFMS